MELTATCTCHHLCWITILELQFTSNRIPFYTTWQYYSSCKTLQFCLDSKYLRIFSVLVVLYWGLTTNTKRTSNLKFVFLGYLFHYKHYKGLAHDGRIYVSKDVLFDEYQFPHPILFHTPSPTPAVSTSCSSSNPVSPMTPPLIQLPSSHAAKLPGSSSLS